MLGILTSRLPWQIWALLGAAVFAGVLVWKIDQRAYNRGFSAADEQWLERVEQELERQEDANKEALRLAQEEIERLEQDRRMRDATINRLLGQVSNLPTANRPAVSADGVRILNSIVE